MSSGVSEVSAAECASEASRAKQAKEWMLQANKWTDEWVAQYFSLDSSGPQCTAGGRSEAHYGSEQPEAGTSKHLLSHYGSEKTRIRTVILGYSLLLLTHWFACFLTHPWAHEEVNDLMSPHQNAMIQNHHSMLLWFWAKKIMGLNSMMMGHLII